MLIPQQAQRERPRSQGSDRGRDAELRRRLANPSELTDGDRQRLLELASRLARVQALGNEYVRVAISPEASAAISPPMASGPRAPAAVA
jgi:hypothetical protein